jgi:hypothetical protein
MAIKRFFVRVIVSVCPIKSNGTGNEYFSKYVIFTCNFYTQEINNQPHVITSPLT